MNEATDQKTYRQRKFAIEVTPARHAEVEGEISLSITWNGCQWTTINLTPEEVGKTVATLTGQGTYAEFRRAGEFAPREGGSSK